MPTTSTTGIPTCMGTPAAQSQPRTAPARPIIDSTERSISPVMMIRVIGSATMATSITALVRLAKLAPVRNTVESRVPRTTSRAMTTRRRVSQRRAREAPRIWVPADAGLAVVVSAGSGVVTGEPVIGGRSLR